MKLGAEHSKTFATEQPESIAERCTICVRIVPVQESEKADILNQKINRYIADSEGISEIEVPPSDVENVEFPYAHCIVENSDREGTCYYSRKFQIRIISLNCEVVKR